MGAARQLTPAPFLTPAAARNERLTAIMELIELLPSDANGALLVGPREKPAGTILVEANRVCWCGAANMSRRLRDILQSHCGVSISERNLDAVYARCRSERKPLGEALVESGLISPSQIRAAIKQHTVESMIAVDQSLMGRMGEDILKWPTAWVGHTGHGYNPRYTFSATELLAAAGALTLSETNAEILSDHLETHLAGGGFGVAFRPSNGGGQQLLGSAGSVDVAVQDVHDLAAWAEAALSASRGFSPEVAHACARSADGAVVAWRYEGEYCAAVCLSSASLQGLTAALGNQSLSVVLATTNALVPRVRQRVRGNNQANNKQGD